MVKHPTLDFGSGGDLRVRGSSPTLASVLRVESAWDSLSLSFCPSVFAFSQINKSLDNDNNPIKRISTKKIKEYSFLFWMHRPLLNIICIIFSKEREIDFPPTQEGLNSNVFSHPFLGMHIVTNESKGRDYVL